MAERAKVVPWEIVQEILQEKTRLEQALKESQQRDQKKIKELETQLSSLNEILGRPQMTSGRTQIITPAVGTEEHKSVELRRFMSSPRSELLAEGILQDWEKYKKQRGY